MAYWFRRKYRLPPTDPRFLAMTPEDIAAEWYADQFFSGEIANEIEDENYDAAVADLERDIGGDTGADEFEDVISDQRR